MTAVPATTTSTLRATHRRVVGARRNPSPAHDGVAAHTATLITGALQFSHPPSHLAPSRGRHHDDTTTTLTAPHVRCAAIDQGPTFAVFQACVCLPCPCINISLLAAVVPPTAQESKPKPRRLVRGSCTMALPVPWCLSRRRNELSSPEGGKATRTHKGRAGRRGPSAAPRKQERFHFTYCTA